MADWRGVSSGPSGEPRPPASGPRLRQTRRGWGAEAAVAAVAAVARWAPQLARVDGAGGRGAGGVAGAGGWPGRSPGESALLDGWLQRGPGPAAGRPGPAGLTTGSGLRPGLRGAAGWNHCHHAHGGGRRGRDPGAPRDSPVGLGGRAGDLTCSEPDLGLTRPWVMPGARIPAESRSF